MKKIKSISVLAFIALTMQLSSCCYGIICDCFDDMDATIGLTFNMDSTNTSGFKRSEIENAINNTDWQQFPTQTNRMQLSQDSIRCVRGIDELFQTKKKLSLSIGLSGPLNQTELFRLKESWLKSASRSASSLARLPSVSVMLWGCMSQ